MVDGADLLGLDALFSGHGGPPPGAVDGGQQWGGPLPRAGSGVSSPAPNTDDGDFELSLLLNEPLDLNEAGLLSTGGDAQVQPRVLQPPRARLPRGCA